MLLRYLAYYRALLFEDLIFEWFIIYIRACVGSKMHCKNFDFGKDIRQFEYF